MARERIEDSDLSGRYAINTAFQTVAMSPRRYGISTSFPIDWRDSINRCASAACASGNVLPITILTFFSVISRNDSSIPRRITSGTAATV